MNTPLLAITMGDPAGIGPEIIVGSWMDGSWRKDCRAVVIGHPEIIRRAIRQSHASVRVEWIESVEDAVFSTDVIPCLWEGNDDALHVEPGHVDARAGQAAFEAIRHATDLTRAGIIDGIVTCPIHKGAMHAAGHNWPGHTEMLADFCGVERVAMMLYLGRGHGVEGRAGLGVAHVTLHCAMSSVSQALTEKRILGRIEMADTVLRALIGPDADKEPPRIGVCALNPHCGEEGLFGDEEISVIQPAVEKARSRGLDASGPFPADTLMIKATRGAFDAVVAMYHEQGHIALKLLGMHRAVNITLGLPIVRTSVAHGTAFDIAWQNKAESSGMVEAIRAAAHLCQHGGVDYSA